jgi:homoserine O-acetyltransferase
VRRFDANSYLTITRAMDLFDLANEHGSPARRLPCTPDRFFVASFSSDWLFPTREAAPWCAR